MVVHVLAGKTRSLNTQVENGSVHYRMGNFTAAPPALGRMVRLRHSINSGTFVTELDGTLLLAAW